MVIVKEHEDDEEKNHIHVKLPKRFMEVVRKIGVKGNWPHGYNNKELQGRNASPRFFKKCKSCKKN